MKIKQLRSLSKEDLQKKEEEMRYELMKLNGQVAPGTNPKNPGQIGQLKKSIAKVKTLLKND